MTTGLRPYQTKIHDEAFAAWGNGHRNVLAVAPTGAGKTRIMSTVVNNIHNPTCSIAHRQELVSQISVALAFQGVYHRIIAADPVVKFCISRHIEEFGKNFHHADAPASVAGVQTIIRREEELRQFMHSVQMWNIDEAHHVAEGNSWWKAIAMFPNAYGLGFTASPIRADRRPLGRSLGGAFDYMVLGPSMRELINMGYLSDYRLIAPTMSIDRSNIPVSESTGELNQTKLRKEAHNSTITGDIVTNYLKFAPGKRGIAFVVDIEQAKDVAERFNAAGIKAMAVSAKTPDKIRQDAIRRFSRGDLTVLVNVDLFGEGFDVPAVEVVMMGRPTESFGLYLQQFGRALRMFKGKDFGIIIDHVGNWKRHGLPDAKRTWSLHQDLRGTPRGVPDPDAIPLRRCTECFFTYEAITRTCPYCGHYEEPEARNGPQFVDGDLTELSPEFLAQLRGDVLNIEHGEAAIPYGADQATTIRLQNLHRARQTAMHELRDAIDMWAGIQTQIYDRNEPQAYSLFYQKYGVDVLTAQTMKTAEMMKLTAKIREGFV